jgi:hypothetical protein
MPMLNLKKIAIVSLLILIVAPLAISAATITIPNPLKVNSFQQLIEVIISAIFNIALLIAPLMFIISGFYWLTSAGNPARLKIAQDIIKWTVIGLIIIIASKGIITLFKSTFGIT